MFNFFYIHFIKNRFIITLALLIIIVILILLNLSNDEIVEGYKNANVFVASNPHRYNNLNIENNNIGLDSTFEIGTIKNLHDDKIKNVYNSSFENSYGDYYGNYYDS